MLIVYLGQEAGIDGSPLFTLITTEVKVSYTRSESLKVPLHAMFRDSKKSRRCLAL